MFGKHFHPLLWMFRLPCLPASALSSAHREPARLLCLTASPASPKPTADEFRSASAWYWTQNEASTFLSATAGSATFFRTSHSSLTLRSKPTLLMESWVFNQTSVSSGLPGRSNRWASKLSAIAVPPNSPAKSASGSRLARALITQPCILLLDEPLSALDLPVRMRIADDLRRSIQNLPIPVLYVTHSRDEVSCLAKGCSCSSTANSLRRDTTRSALRAAGRNGRPACRI